MTTSLKDVSSAEMVRKLAEMNCFEQECTVYGYAWRRENGKRMYSMSEDEFLIQQAFETHLTEQCSLTPVRQLRTRAVIKEETQEDLFLYLKLQLAQQIRQDFNETYFSCMETLQRAPGDDQAEGLLLEWQEELDGYFNEEELSLFAGAVNYAYITKHLPVWRYQQLQKWIRLTRKQMMRRMRVHDNFSRTFYGIACITPGTTQYQYICNANEKTLYNRVKELDEQGVLHTPVYQKTYWYSRSNDLAQVRKRFDADLRDVMNERYLARIAALQQLPSAIPQPLWEDCLRRAEEGCSPEAVEGLRYWGRRWNII